MCVLEMKLMINDAWHGRVILRVFIVCTFDIVQTDHISKEISYLIVRVLLIPHLQTAVQVPNTLLVVFSPFLCQKYTNLQCTV